MGTGSEMPLQSKAELSYPLMLIFNLSMRTGGHPRILRIAKVIPVYKKGSRLVTSNYRPISLLSNINKILEKIIHNRVYKFLEENKCLYSHQFGFRRNHSTNHALMELTENVRKALDKNDHACGVFVDLQKAFDTVNHHILLQKIDHYGIRGNANNWFRSYLSERTQYVSILGFDSKIESISHGVPQGSVLGPLLFLIYINDLHNAIKYSNVFHFADDTNLLHIHKNPAQLQKEINLDLKTLFQWLLTNLISLNADKTEYIMFHKPRTKAPDLKLKMNGKRLYPSKYIKYIGVLVDEHLNFNTHCQMLLKRLHRANGMLCKIRHFVPEQDLRSLYFSLFSSHLTYGCQIWGQVKNNHNQAIFKAQKRSLRILNWTSFRAPTDPLFYQSKILKLEDQIIILNMRFAQQVISDNTYSPECFNEYFRLAIVHEHNTSFARHGNLFIPSRRTVTYGDNSITNKIISHWNRFSHPSSKILNLSPSEIKSNFTTFFLQTYLQ